MTILHISDTHGLHERLGALPPAVLAQSSAPTVIVQENNALRETIQRLNERLNEPFVTVNTVTGDMGIKQAQDDYQRLMNNKSPKSKRK